MKSLQEFSRSSANLGAGTLLVFGALLGSHGVASASAHPSQHATSCHPYLDATGAGLSYMSTGLVVGPNAFQNIVCPIARPQEPGPIGMITYVDGYVSVGTVKCTVWSSTFDGSPLGSATKTFTGPGRFDLPLALSQAQVPPWSSQAVVCTLPAGTSFWDIDLDFPGT
jgi:hypothetical protein